MKFLSSLFVALLALPSANNSQVRATVVLTVDTPVAIVERRVDENAAYIVSRPGLVLRWDYNTKKVSTVLNISALTTTGNERGLLGLAFRGDFAYINYTNTDGHTVIAEYAVEKNGIFRTSSRRELMTILQPYANHNGGDIVTGPDNMLYIGMGDGGSGGDPERNALNTASLLGKMLRINPTRTSSKPYTIPTDNPFVGVKGARGEIWSVGLRNPWRFSFDDDQNMWIADVGQNKWEEINLAKANKLFPGGHGVNFGWSAYEGKHRFNADQTASSSLAPIYEYAHGSAGCSVSGGVRVSKTNPVVALRDKYLFSDFCSGVLKGLQLQETKLISTSDLIKKLGRVIAVQQTSRGIYVLAFDGKIYSITVGNP
ncbi:MAG: sugar dehydrogenase [Ilumatobacteraceae bacterium]|nr:sugar dehydrogenase [Ilumatobacteraceae bacterium]